MCLSRGHSQTYDSVLGGGEQKLGGCPRAPEGATNLLISSAKRSKTCPAPSGFLLPAGRGGGGGLVGGWGVVTAVLLPDASPLGTLLMRPW